ncbi:MAG TPA: ABC transporter substrate-binding protein [Ilumatobacter sp.]|nr:ABC transporter substrate-binding protein [Ilumatobacter sp.]
MPTRRQLLIPLLVTATALGLAACGDDEPATSATPAPTGSPSTEAPASTDPPADAACADGGPEIVIGAQDFGESVILSEVYGQALSHAGCTVRQQALGGYRPLVFESFSAGAINFTAEYAASALEFLNEGAQEASGDIDATAELLRGHLSERGLVGLAASPAVDSNSFVVTPETAEALSLTAVSDLTDDLRLGGPADCPDNPFCIPGLQSVYGIDLSGNFVPLDGAGPITVAALEGGEIDVAILFSTDGVIADKGWVVLDDDQGLINADNIIPVVSQELADAHSGLQELVDAVSAALDTAQLTELNRRYSIDAEDADDVARDWLTQAGFLG